MNSKENFKSLWEEHNYDYQLHVTISTTELIEEANEKTVYMNDLGKRKQVYGICGE
ncbi:hypothetical protein RhiirA4_411143, partial [Rhizophagus irregularis]